MSLISNSWVQLVQLQRGVCGLLGFVLVLFCWVVFFS